MTTDAPVKRRHRARWVVLVAALALVGVLVAVLIRTGAVPDPAAPPPATGTVTMAPGTAPAPARTADGCLGGPDPHTAVLGAQLAAPLDSVGAAGFAMAMTRWAFTTPPDGNADAVIDQVFLDPGPVHQSSAETQWDHEMHTFVSGGEYRSVNSTGTSAVVQVKIQRSDVEGLHPTVRMVLEWNLTAVLGHWRALPVSGPTVGAEPFVEGFVPYVNVGCGR